MSEEQQDHNETQQNENHNAAAGADPELVQAVREQVLEQIRQEQQSEQQQKQKAREEEKKAHNEYVEKMKQSTEPWVEVVGMSQSNDGGVKVELEWNDAFVDFLRENGISGTDDEQIVQRWVTLLLRDMADQMDDSKESTYE